MRERRVAEIEILAKVHEVDHDDDQTWVIVRSLPLEDGWNRPSTDILFFLPPSYPQVPPDNFYVPAGLRLEDGRTPNNFQPQNRSHEAEQWDMFSFHHESGWHPAANPADGSNLLTFLGAAVERLSELD